MGMVVLNSSFIGAGYAVRYPEGKCHIIQLHEIKHIRHIRYVSPCCQSGNDEPPKEKSSEVTSTATKKKEK